MQAIIATYFWQIGLKNRSIRRIRFAADIIENADLSSDRYLYRFGEYITENELGTARRLRSLPEETIQKMADVLHGRISDRIYQYRKRSVQKNQS